MIKREKDKQDGAPMWVVTYGDMMSLLLTFFVLLVSMSELKRDVRFKKVMESIRIAFGHEGGIGRTPTEEPPLVSLVKRLMEIQIPKEIMHIGSSPDPGIEARHFRVTEVRDGVKITFGGALRFERFSARLLPKSELALAPFAERIRGLNNIIEIIGHTTQEPLPDDCGFRNRDELAFARAEVIRDHLQQLDINPARMRLISAADREPFYKEAYTEERRARNRRVEIVVRESLIGDYEGREMSEEERVNHGR